MDDAEDEQSSTEAKKTKADLNTAVRDSNTSRVVEQDGRRTVSELPTAPVIADAGTTQRIEGTATAGQILPFESQVQGHIGRQLRALYDHVLDQPVPDRFVALLKQLDGHRTAHAAARPVDQAGDRQAAGGGDGASGDASTGPLNLHPKDINPPDPKGDD